MIITIDVGNTNIVFGIISEGKVLHKWRMATRNNTSSEEYFVFLNNLLTNSTSYDNIKNIRCIVISSVVPQINFHLIQMCQEYFSLSPLIVGDERCNIDLKMRVDNPNNVGVDLICDALGARLFSKQDVLVIDFGTATTFFVTTHDREFLGGVIALGANMIPNAMNKGTAQLPLVNMKKTDKLINKNTISCMQAGFYYGYLDMVRGIISRIKAEHPNHLEVIATGGLVSLFASEINEIDQTIDDLILFGMNYIYHLNNNKSER